MLGKQIIFTGFVSKLIEFAFANGYSLTFGEAYRTAEQQKIYFDTGRSKTLNSRHLQRLAVDFNIFKNGRMLFGDKANHDEDVAWVKPLGDYWVSLHQDCVWGGNFTSLQDYYHFELKPD